MVLIIDTENSGAQRDKAAPFNYDNKCCYIGTLSVVHDMCYPVLYSVEYNDSPYKDSLEAVRYEIDNAKLLVGFNLKYDLHWLRRYGIRANATRIFDVQLAWFILTAQKNPYPSLNKVAEYYGIETKLDIVKEEYWNKGLDTNEVPRRILEEYLEQDLKVTYLCYLKVMEDLEKQSYEMQRLVSVAMQDLMVLAEMEWNGMLINTEKSIRKGDIIVEQIKSMDESLRKRFGYDWLNPNSGDHISAILYGGTIKIPYRENYSFVYKDGREVWKERNSVREIKTPRLVEPPKKSGLSKEGFYSTDQATLKLVQETSNKAIKQIINLLLSRAKLAKQRSTYYHGYPKKLTEWNWKDNIIHTTLNQCVAITGRLSSSKPNLQNVEEEVHEIFITRYK
ncbi:MAG: hypothetical protein A3F67_05835 [Verrucomicrobia bacterium RIFCSPHIGHO2_12_FULL_41_10]|nr:MAG: hypothetical protein A3F67_05835 [Verrucomicrobia bacterium RIFCSPHIGHO2_12_FULL_41_10]